MLIIIPLCTFNDQANDFNGCLWVLFRVFRGLISWLVILARRLADSLTGLHTLATRLAMFEGCLEAIARRHNRLSAYIVWVRDVSQGVLGVFQTARHVSPTTQSLSTGARDMSQEGWTVWWESRGAVKWLSFKSWYLWDLIEMVFDIIINLYGYFTAIQSKYSRLKLKR